ncbi:2,3-bisphosphoglycerate-independent phosphoglycerate mutase [bacterium]|nr:MAG: 2,3-bisphosphoglycerate-independent phosphoglycerate mutase [bacterium]
MRKTALIILDGWGYRPERENNAIAEAGTPNLDKLCREYPCATLAASGLAVGLPEGQMGNSEVGHLNLGAGRIVYQDLTRINLAVKDGSIKENRVLREACDAAARGGKALHLMGLLSDGGVHSHQEHLYALVRMAKLCGVKNIFVHAFMDGRDTPPRSGLGYVEKLEAALKEIGAGRIATVSGRFYAMDRDNRWERVEKAYRALVRGEGERAGSAAEAVKASYEAGQVDEFILPTVVVAEAGSPAGKIEDGDSVVFFNFRSDRARQLTRVFTEEGFSHFDVSDRPRLSSYVTMTEYDETFTTPIAFPQQTLRNILAEVLSDAGKTQLRIAETEKYAHVTFFFNGGVEKSWPGEERILIPSPREVATYDQKPQMSAFAVRDRLLQEIESKKFDNIVVNFANLDMVGHTGIMEAAKEAVKAVDSCVGELAAALCRNGYCAIITADHGNAEEMWDAASGQPMTAHTTNRVPLILMDDDLRGEKLRADGILADVAPTLLALMGVEIPPEMTGRSLLAK